MTTPGEMPWPPAKQDGEDEVAWRLRLEESINDRFTDWKSRLNNNDPAVLQEALQIQTDNVMVDAFVSAVPKDEIGPVPTAEELGISFENIQLLAHERDMRVMDGDPDAVERYVEDSLFGLQASEVLRYE